MTDPTSAPAGLPAVSGRSALSALSALSAPEEAPDSDRMWQVTAGLPEQVEWAVAAASEAARLPAAKGAANIVALGMGGSGIGGDVLNAIAGPLVGVPVVVSKDYACPAFVGPDSLVFAASYSGNTEETLEAATGARERGARIVCITGGGRLAELAQAWEAGLVPLPDVPWPRAAFGALAVSPLIILERLGMLDGMTAAASSAVSQLRARRDRLFGPKSEASEIARRLARTIPLIHGGGALGAAAALRWKCQVNENPKSPAFSSTQPELCHNEVTGWGQHGDATRQLVSLVMLRHDYEHPQVARRFDAVAAIVEEVVADIVPVRAAGAGPLAQLFDLAFVGDVVSLHLAAREGIDPGPIPILMELKQALAGPAPS